MVPDSSLLISIMLREGDSVSMDVSRARDATGKEEKSSPCSMALKSHSNSEGIYLRYLPLQRYLCFRNKFKSLSNLPVAQQLVIRTNFIPALLFFTLPRRQEKTHLFFCLTSCHFTLILKDVHCMIQSEKSFYTLPFASLNH